MDRLAWIDVETTGLDPDEDCLLEVALVITDPELNIEAQYESIILPAHDKWGMCPYVAKMHDDNYLLYDIRKLMDDEEQFGISCHRVPAVMRELFDFVVRNNAIDLPLAGSCPSFDRRFLKKNMPQVEALFSYCHFDLSTLRILHGVKHNSDDEKCKHRAMPDIMQDIAFARSFLPNQNNAELCS